MEETELGKRLRVALTDFLWDQWVAIGMAGHANGRAVPFVIDPEALLLATLRFSFHEGRFQVEVLDWLRRNGALLSVQRAKNLDLAMRIVPPELLSGLCDFMEKSGHPNWKSLGARVRTRDLTDFSGVNLRGMSQEPDPSRSESFMLRLRLLLGVNARSEIIAWILTHSEGYAAGIAADTGWFSKSVQAILNDLERGGMLVGRVEGKRKLYSMSPRNRVWHPDFVSGLRWFGQRAFYVGAFFVMKTLDEVGDAKLSPQARAIAVRRDLSSLEAAFRECGLGDLYAATRGARGEDLIHAFHAGTARLLEMLESRERFGVGVSLRAEGLRGVG